MERALPQLPRARLDADAHTGPGLVPMRQQLGVGMGWAIQGPQLHARQGHCSGRALMTEKCTQSSDVAMYRVTRGASYSVGTLRASDLTTHGDLLTRAKYEVALMVDKRMGRCILQGSATLYSTGEVTIWPCNARGKHLVRDGRTVTYWLNPYTYKSVNDADLSPGQHVDVSC